VDASCRVLELGCGYGRVLSRLAERAGAVLGIDLSRESLALARRDGGRAHLAQMDALALGIRDAAFDVVVCVQNGVSAVGGDPRRLLAEALRVTRHGGRVFLSSYAEQFWEERLRWFELHAAHGLVGPIDYARTGAGTIVCHDGFRATTVTPAEFHALAAELGQAARVTEVDGSSVMCEIRA
jgi:SAM-dependent methyltransferase